MSFIPHGYVRKGGVLSSGDELERRLHEGVIVFHFMGSYIANNIISCCHEEKVRLVVFLIQLQPLVKEC